MRCSSRETFDFVCGSASQEAQSSSGKRRMDDDAPCFETKVKSTSEFANKLHGTPPAAAAHTMGHGGEKQIMNSVVVVGTERATEHAQRSSGNKL